MAAPKATRMDTAQAKRMEELRQELAEWDDVIARALAKRAVVIAHLQPLILLAARYE